MKKREYERQLQQLLAKCENLTADVQSAEGVSAHYKKEIEQLKGQLAQATELIADLSAQLEKLARAEQAEPVAVAQPAPQESPAQATPQQPSPATGEPAEAPGVVPVDIRAGVTPQIDYGAKAIGDAVFACTKFCNQVTAAGGELQRDLVHLALGKTEVFKGTVLAILEQPGPDTQKQAAIAEALAEVLEYFENLKQQG